MSVFVNVNIISDNFIIAVINTKLFSYYVNTFVNNTQTFQINDARQLPILIPDEKTIHNINTIVENAIERKIHGKDISELEELVETMIHSLYGI